MLHVLVTCSILLLCSIIYITMQQFIHSDTGGCLVVSIVWDTMSEASMKVLVDICSHFLCEYTQG